jgi:hypothetical protein
VGTGDILIHSIDEVVLCELIMFRFEDMLSHKMNTKNKVEIIDNIDPSEETIFQKENPSG